MDPFSLDEADTPERQAALAAALRRQNDLGLLFQLSGDKVLGNVGGTLVNQVDRGEQRLELGKQRRLQLGLEAKKDQENQDYQKRTLDLQSGHLRLAQQNAEREKYTPLPTASGFAVFDPRSGGVRMLSGPDGQPVMPVKFGDHPGDEQGALKKMSDALEAQFKRGGSNGKNLERLQAFERILTAGQDDKGNPRPLNPSQTAEFYTNFNTALGGSQSLGQLEHLLPHTVRGDWAKALEWVTNHPQDAGAQEFVKNVLEIAKREMATIAAQNLRSLERVIPAYAPTLKRYASARKALGGYGITEDMLDPETFQPLKAADPVQAGQAAQGGAPKAAAPDHAAAMGWARAHPDDPRAREILAAQSKLGLADGR